MVRGVTLDTRQVEQPAKVAPREELVLLALYGNELYGLEIAQAMEEASTGRKQFKIGSLYPTLHGLEKRGLIESWWGDEERPELGGARRRYYRITGKGRATVDDFQHFRQELIRWRPSPT
ncbi:putative transcriptional regulator [Rubidibacter lacunae KORDI 51-2]|uniref:Putative transcriptional regulator n=2 Tax=Rubidibacter TaxID=582491 RepID=U5DEZ7_9CHRO|nr:putative transcriptional regulator [Rubidibacter lacunae KORDI 51-2]